MSLARSMYRGAAAAAVLSTSSLVLAQGVDRSGDPKIPREITYPDPHYYVAPDGNDSASGKSEAEPWATLAPLRSVRSGTVYLKRGGTWQANLSVNGITVSSYGTGDRPIIDGSASMQSNGALEGVKVDGTGRIGVTISGSNNVVKDCEIDGRSGTFELGFGVMGTGNLIVGNHVHHLSAMSGDTGDMNTSGGSEAFMIMGSFNEIAYNIASEAHGVNKTLGGEEGGCYEIVNGKAGATIENVYFHHNYCERSIGFWEGCSGNFQGTDKIQENHGIIKNVVLAYNVSVDAMWLYLIQPVNTDFENVVFEHNTLVHTPANHADFTQQARDMWGLQVTSDQGYTSEPLKPGAIVVRNNLFYVAQGGTTASFMGTLPAADHYNNLFANVANPGWTLGEGELKVDAPGLTADYRLAQGSPAIDKGSAKSWQPWTDYDGNAVPLGAAPDIGASEYCDGTDCKAAAPLPGTGGSAGASGEAGAGGGAGNKAAGAGGGGTAGGKAAGGGNSGGAGGGSHAGGNASTDPGGGAAAGDSGNAGRTNGGDGDGPMTDAAGSSSSGALPPAESGCRCRATGEPSGPGPRGAVLVGVALAAIFAGRRRAPRKVV